jgi:hypothetical protein
MIAPDLTVERLLILIESVNSGAVEMAAGKILMQVYAILFTRTKFIWFTKKSTGLPNTTAAAA